jgi:hypothetical protein
MIKENHQKCKEPQDIQLGAIETRVGAVALVGSIERGIQFAFREHHYLCHRHSLVKFLAPADQL